MIRYLTLLFLTVALRAAPSITATASYVSDYMFRGEQIAGACLQPTVDITAGNLDLGVWNSTPLNQRGLRDQTFEVTYYGTYSADIGMGVSLVPGFTYYTYPRALTNDGSYRTTAEPSLGLSFTLIGVKLAPTTYYDMTLKAATFELASSYALPLKALGTELDLNATVGTYRATDSVNGPQTRAWGDYWLAGVSVPITLSKATKLTVGWTYTTNWDAFSKQGRLPRDSDSSARRGIVSASYGYSF